MSEIFSLLQNTGVKFNPPLDHDRVARLPEVIQATVDPRLLDFYAKCDGMRRTRALPVRFMSLAEVEDTNIAFRDIDSPTNDFRVFWTDDESNYVGYFVQGLLLGKLCRVDHDENEFSPVFRSLDSFLNKLLAAGAAKEFLHSMPTDYPKTEPSTNFELDLEDRKLAMACITNFEKIPEDNATQFWGLSALNLLTQDDLDLVVRFTESNDMWVQAKACDLLGLWRIESAIPILSRVVRTGMHNGRTASLSALGAIGTFQAREELFQLADDIESGYKDFVSLALKKCGVKMKRLGNDWHYQISDTDDWRSL